MGTPQGGQTNENKDRDMGRQFIDRSNQGGSENRDRKSDQQKRQQPQQSQQQGNKQSTDKGSCGCE